MKMKLFVFGAILFMVQSCKKSTDNILTEDAATVVAISQTSLPTTVVNSFTSKFTGATQVEWFSVSATSTQSKSFEVEFNHLNQRHEASFDDNGTENHHNVTCINAAVPQVVIAAFRATHATDTVFEWNLRNDGTWKAHYKKGGVNWEATYSATGTLIKDEKS